MAFSNSPLLHVAVERLRVCQVAPPKTRTRRSGRKLVAELADLFDFLASLIVFEKHHPSRILHALKDGPMSVGKAPMCACRGRNVTEAIRDDARRYGTDFVAM